MAVNKITNKQTLNKELVNRANQVSTKETTVRGNRETSITPGNNSSDNYAKKNRNSSKYFVRTIFSTRH